MILLTKLEEFKKLLYSKDLTFAMEAHNGLSALLVEKAGFDVIWASGLSIATSLGLRDSNELSWSQLADMIEYMANATKIPILVDGDSGHGNFNNVRILVKKLSKVGAAALCLEDKIFPKTNSFITNSCNELVSIQEFCGKIKAAKDSLLDDNFSIIARVEALIAGASMREALERASAYYEAGADGILIHSKKDDATEILEFARLWENRCPLIIVPTKYYKTPTEKFIDAKISMAIWANHNIRSCIKIMQYMSKKIFNDKTLVNIEKEISSVQEIFELLNYSELEEAETKYLIKDNFSEIPEYLRRPETKEEETYL